jgi:hypothetical protein
MESVERLSPPGTPGEVEVRLHPEEIFQVNHRVKQA